MVNSNRQSHEYSLLLNVKSHQFTNTEFPVISRENEKKKKKALHKVQFKLPFVTSFYRSMLGLTTTFKVKEKNKPLCTINAGLTVLSV